MRIDLILVDAENEFAALDGLARGEYSRQTDRVHARVRTSVGGAVRTREFERDSARHRITEVRADSVGRLDRAERAAEPERDPEAMEG